MNAARLTWTTVLAVAVGLPAALGADGPSATVTEAYELRMAGRSDEAHAVLERALADDAQDPRAWFEMARTEVYHFEFDVASDAIAKAIELDPENARYHSFDGMTAAYNAVLKAKSPATRDRVEPEMGRSLAAFDRAVEIDPDDHDARIMLINMLLEAPRKQGGSRKRAKAHVEMLESKDAVRGVEARCMFEDESRRKCLARWEKAIAGHPTSAEAHAGLAKECLEDGDLDRARREIETAIRLDPSCRELLLALCRQHATDGNQDAGRKAVERYLGLEPALPAPMKAFGTFYLAVLQKQQGNREQADALLAEAKRIDPHVWTTFMEPPSDLFDAP